MLPQVVVWKSRVTEIEVLSHQGGQLETKLNVSKIEEKEGVLHTLLYKNPQNMAVAALARHES